MTTATTTKTTAAKGSRKLPFPVEIASEQVDTDPIEKLKKRKDLAVSCHLATKQSAIQAVAHACVYSRMITDDVDLAKWQKRQIESRNSQIKEHNKQLDRDERRAFDFVMDRLDKNDRIFTAETVEAKKAADEEKTKLRELARRTKEEWKALRQVEIKARKDAGFTETVKFVFELDKPEDAPTVSRYQQVMQWVFEECKSSFPDTHQPIIDMINEARGFDAVLKLQRAKKKPMASANDNANKKAQERDEKAETIRRALLAEKAKGSCEATLDAADGLVVVLGRYSKEAGSLEVVRNFTLSPDELNDLLVRYGPDAAQKD